MPLIGPSSVAREPVKGSAHLGQGGGEPLRIERFLAHPQIKVQNRSDRGGQRDRQQGDQLLDAVARHALAYAQAGQYEVEHRRDDPEHGDGDTQDEQASTWPVTYNPRSGTGLTQGDSGLMTTQPTMRL